MTSISPTANQGEWGLATVDEVATLYCATPRTIYRWADAGRIPRPIKINSAVRWRRRTGDPMTGVLDHIDAGCPDCRRASI